MSPRPKRVSKLRVIVATASAVVITTIGTVGGACGCETPIFGGGGGGEGLAHIWVDDDGGSCDRSATQIAYVDATACPNPVEAWAETSSGDTVRVLAKVGGYDMPASPNSGHFTGDKTSDTKIIGDESGVIFNTDGAGELEADGNHLWLENVTLDSSSTHGWSMRIGGNGPDSADDVTFKNVNVKGLYFGLEIYDGDRFEWDGGVFGEEGVAGERCGPDIEPLQINGNTGHRIANLVFWPQGGADACSVDGFHEEDIRVESTNTTIENILFEDGTAVNRNAGSGKIFLSGSNVQGLVIRNVVFGPGEPSANNAIDANVTGCTVTIAYSTFTDEGTSLTGCTATLLHNVGPDSPGVGPDGHLPAEHAAIDAGEAGTGSDYCVNELGSRDFEGDVRPQGSACDAGADERE